MTNAGLDITQLAMIGGGVLVILIIAALLVFGDSRKKRLHRRIDRLKERRVSGGVSITKNSVEAAMTLRRKKQQKHALADIIMKPLPDMEQLTRKLERVGSELTAKQYIFRCFIIAFMIAGLFTFVGLSPWIGVAVGLMIGVWIPLKFINMRINRQKKKFLVLFPDAIDLIIRGLRSGLPLAESITLVSDEIPKPVGSTFQHISDTMKLGVPLEKAMLDMGRELDLTEFNFFTTSIILQRETGGNLSEILDNLSETLRSRFMMQMKIKALSSEARASAIIVGALPFFVTAAISVISPNYIAILFDDYRGNIAALSALGMLGFGVMVMRKMSKFEI